MRSSKKVAENPDLKIKITTNQQTKKLQAIPDGKVYFIELIINNETHSLANIKHKKTVLVSFCPREKRE